MNNRNGYAVLTIGKNVTEQEIINMNAGKFEGTKQLHALPLTRGQYNIARGWIIPADENPDDLGYLVIYKDGYPSWSPKNTFEEYYKQIDTFEQRVNNEFKDLGIKVTALHKFLEGDFFKTLDVDAQVKLQLQYYTMLEYEYILECRITGDAINLKYGDVIIALSLGYCVARKDWNAQNIFVCKQIPSEVSAEIIPKLQSLPQSAKDILATYGIAPLKYKNQMLIINMITKEATSWVANSNDTFATDWYIYKL